MRQFAACAAVPERGWPARGPGGMRRGGSDPLPLSQLNLLSQSPAVAGRAGGTCGRAPLFHRPSHRGRGPPFGQSFARRRARSRLHPQPPFQGAGPRGEAAHPRRMGCSLGPRTRPLAPAHRRQGPPGRDRLGRTGPAGALVLRFLSQNQVLAAEGPRPRGPSCLGKESLLLRWKHCGCVPLGTCTLRTQYCHQGGTERGPGYLWGQAR